MNPPAEPEREVRQTPTSLPSAPVSMWTNPIGVIEAEFVLPDTVPRREPSPDAPSTEGIYLRLEGLIYGPLQLDEVEGLMGSGLLTGYEVVSRDLSAWTPLAYHPRMIATRGSDIDTAHDLLSQYSHLPAASDRVVDPTETLFEDAYLDEETEANTIEETEPETTSGSAQILRKPNMLVRVSSPSEQLDIRNPGSQPGDYGDLVAHLRKRSSSPVSAKAVDDEDSGGPTLDGAALDAANRRDTSNNSPPERGAQRAIFRKLRLGGASPQHHDEEELAAPNERSATPLSDASDTRDDARSDEALLHADTDDDAGAAQTEAPAADAHALDADEAKAMEEGAPDAERAARQGKNKASRKLLRRALLGLFFLLLIGAAAVLWWLELLPLP